MAAIWITLDYAADLADCHKTTLLRRATAGEVAVRERPSARHAGKTVTEVDLDSLGAVARKRWQMHRRTVVPMPAPVHTPLHENAASEGERADSGGLSSDKLAWAQFRYLLIEPLLNESWRKSAPTRAEFIAALCARAHSAPNGTLKRYSPSAVARMIARFRSEGMAGLANDTRSDRGTTRRLTGEMQLFIAAAYCSGGSARYYALRSIREVCRLVDEERERRALLHSEGALLDYVRRNRNLADGEVRAPEEYLFPRASYGTIERFIRSIPEPAKVLAREGPKAYAARCEPVILRDYTALAPMDWVVFDHRRCDIFVLYRKRGQLILMRPWETVALDMKSRMVVGSVMCEVPSALSVASCIRQIVLRFGLFKHAYLDNGKEFTAQFIDGAGPAEGDRWRQDYDAAEFAATRGIFGELGIEATHAAPFNARAKIIEPSFRNPAAFERTLAGACGNRSVNRPEFLAAWEKEFKRWDPNASANHPFLPYDRFRQLKDHFYFEDYPRRKHTGRAMEGRTPMEVMKSEYLDLGLARTVDPRALDLLLQKRRIRKVGQGGTLTATFGGEDYVYTAPALFTLQGREVEAAYDPYQLGEMVVYEPGADFICVAQCQRLYGMGEREIAEPIKERRRIAREIKQQLRAVQRYASIPSAGERFDWAQAVAAAQGARPVAASGAPNTRLTPRFERAAAAVASAPGLPPAASDHADDIEFLGSV